MPSPSYIHAYYRVHARIYDQTRWLFLHGRGPAMDALDLRPGEEVCEVGCGTGLNFTSILARIGPPPASLTGIDLSPDMLSRARRRVARDGAGRVRLELGTLAELGTGTQFDAILFAYSLSLMPDWEASLERACAALRPGGRLVVLDFGDFSAWSLLRRPILAWLRWHHVDTAQDPAGVLRSRLHEVSQTVCLGGWYRVIRGRNGRTPV